MEKEGFRGRTGKDKGAYPLIDDTRGPGFQGQGRESASWPPTEINRRGIRDSRCCSPTCAPFSIDRLILDHLCNLSSASCDLELRVEKKKRKRTLDVSFTRFLGRKEGKTLSSLPCVNFSTIGESFRGHVYSILRGWDQRFKKRKKRFLLEQRQNTRIAVTTTVQLSSPRVKHFRRQYSTEEGNQEEEEKEECWREFKRRLRMMG